jgi:isoleucyl-tRNA synthetase
MVLAQKIVSTGRAARNRKNLKVRQPLAGVLVNIPGRKQFEKVAQVLQIIKDELNVKDVEELKDISTVVSYEAKLNFAEAGSRLGKNAKETAARLAKLNQDDIKQFLSSAVLKLDIGEAEVELSSDDLVINKNEKDGYAVENTDGITVALKTEINDNLRDEGFAREIVNKVQNMRKSSGFEVTDRIEILVDTSDPLASALEKYRASICSETLADKINLTSPLPDDNEGKNWNINGVKANIAVIKK